MPAAAHNKLARYVAKRNFSSTAEPRGAVAGSGKALSFVIQKHAASRLHYDFRLELDGVLVSWAVPKGPSFDPADKRMAIHVEDHPLSYGTFEGTIPPKQYGSGTVIVWDAGTWRPLGDPHDGLARGKLAFILHGQKMSGAWELVKIAKPHDKQEPWLLFKKRDAHARSRAEYDVITALPDSVIAKPLKPGAAADRGERQRESVKPTSPITAVKAALPAVLAPQLATLVDEAPTQGTWQYEIKFDGYRIMARIHGGNVRLLTRGQKDWSHKMPALVRAIQALPMRSGWLDGEIVVLDEHGAPSFNALQKAFDVPSSQPNIVYFAFDLPFFEGHDLRALPLVERRRLLQAMLAQQPSDVVRFSVDIDGDAASVLRSACRMKLEGVIAKRADAPYVSGRTTTWLKLKCQQRQAFVVAGYTDRSDDGKRIGSLLLGVYSIEGELISVGSVGTGWDMNEAALLKRKLAAIEATSTSFVVGVRPPGRWRKRAVGSERWVRPTLVVEVTFSEWTPEGQIRHASYEALRTDKPAASVQRGSISIMPSEPPSSIAPSLAKPVRRRATSADQADANPLPHSASGKVNGPSSAQAGSDTLKVTHGERVIDASTGLTKLDLVRYYASIAEWLLPHLKARPVSLLRCPDGVHGASFFQKHDEKRGIPGLRLIDAALWPEHPALIEAPTVKAVLGAAQMNVIEFHTWNATTKALVRPDRMIFDLDPGEGTPWQHVQEAAMMVRTLLAEVGLKAWVKTSGGKGLHVLVPLKPQHDHVGVKAVSKSLAQHLATTVPSRIVAKSGPANRVGKIFVDYLRNGEGATTVAAFSARARPGMGVSMPVSWEQLATLKSGAHFTVANARDHVSFQSVDPWLGVAKAKQTLTQAIQMLAVKI